MKIDLKVMAGAKRNAWKDEPSGIKVYLTAPAVEGKANKALIDFLSNRFCVSKAKVEITKGLKSRHKTIMIQGI